jgi:hypothetical protein
MFNIKGDLKAIKKGLSRMQKKQLPFASAMAINSTLFDIQKAEKVQIQKKLDRPIPFTVKGFRVVKAKKYKLRGSVEIQPNRWKYLKYQVEGGTRTKNVLVPTSKAKLNAYGNIAGKRTGLVKKKTQFLGTINGTTGLWQKTGGKRNPKTSLLIGLRKSASYQKKFPFAKIAQGVARSKFQKNLRRELARAMRTAR